MDSRLVLNVRLFVGFRLLFGIRYYYPVLAVFFIDSGITTAQYALLNTAWAATIVLLELPSGALADHLGRRNLVVFAAALMVLEMAALVFAPTIGPWLLIFFLANRILSGAAEAAASGADEALAYDSLVATGREDRWPRVMEKLGHWQSLFFFCAMLLGAAVYDAATLNHALAWLGIDSHFTSEQTRRLPVALTLIHALGALALALCMKEPPGAPKAAPSLAALLRGIWNVGRWIWRTPAVRFVLLIAVLIDASVRMLLTFNSTYYRLLQVPDGWFGLLGAGFALLGIPAATFGRRLAESGRPWKSFALLATITLGSLAGIALVIPGWGLIFVGAAGMMFGASGQLLSFHLNQFASPEQRATALSFRGLTMNLAYGAAGMLFYIGSRQLQSEGRLPEALVLAKMLPWLPIIFGVGAITLFILHRKNPHEVSGDSSPEHPPARD